MEVSDGYGRAFRTSILIAAIWYLLAAVAILSIAAVNGGALVYYDTGGYLVQGENTLQHLGLADPAGDAEPEAAANDAADETRVRGQDGEVAGNRSAIYGLVLASLRAAASPDGMMLVNALAIGLAVWLLARVAVREYGPPPQVHPAVALPILAGSLGALPFYVAYLMPDIFAAVLLLVIATVAAFGRQMRLWEGLLAVALGVAAVLVHPSHLLIAVLMLPVIAVVELVMRRRGWWLTLVMMLLLVLVGTTERVAFRSAAEIIAKSEVVYYPLITARLIEDGPGLIYLNDRCPDPTLATCALHRALSRSADQRRLSATRIIFDKSAELGSYRLLPLEDRKRVSDEQINFFLNVFTAHPVDTSWALLRNTLVQAGRYSIAMTIPTDSISQIVAKSTNRRFDGRLTADRSWIGTVDVVHGWLYAVSGLVALVLLLWPKLLPAPFRTLGVLIGLGILVNAFVCGAISQPADRYGARVIWLLPFSAVFLAMFSRAVGSKLGARRSSEGQALRSPTMTAPVSRAQAPLRRPSRLIPSESKTQANPSPPAR